MAYQMYRSTTLGEALEHVLQDFQNDGHIPPMLTKRVMDIFDKVFTTNLSNRTKNRYTYRAEKLRAYRFCDNVWTFIIEDVNIKDQQNKQSMTANNLKIVACDANRKV
uniref:Transcription initiation factor IIA subunit 2 n=1 Tax=Panagrolaimus sp. JU765 TaxID=591449 RepID=A0AC34RF22_9BILA